MTKLATLGLAALVSAGLVACGGGGGSSSSTSTSAGAAGTGSGGGGASGGSASSAVRLAADPSQIAYQTNSLSAKSGNVAIDFNNPNQGTQHDVCVRDANGRQLGCSKAVTGSSTTLDLKNLKPGSYTFYCSVDSHEQLGMKGTLQVQ